jgi:hypothetical protein
VPYVLVEDFKSGIDTRRTAVTSVPGSLFGTDSTGKAGLTNAHITRGGEIEKRKAFKVWATLPAGTHGLAAGGRRVYVFGSTASPSMTGQPPELSYIKMANQYGQPPSSGASDMAEVLSVDFFDGKPYASILFEDGKINHYWGDEADPGVSASGGSPANRIVQIFDGRARVSTTITGGNTTSVTGTAASVQFYITGGTSTPGNNLKNLRINNVDVLTGPIAHTGSDTTTGVAIAAAINGLTSTPNYTATESGGTVFITSVTKGTSQNGLSVTNEREGDFTTSSGSTLTGGIDSAITDYKINGKSIIGSPVLWEDSHTYTAQKLADEINSTATSPEWDAESTGAKVVVIAEDPGTAYNSLAVATTVTGGVTYTNSASTTSGGANVVSSTAQQAGKYITSNKYAMHSLEESTWRWCAVNEPGDWVSNPNTTAGAGFQVLSNHARNSEELMAMSTYYENMAILAQDCIQIWYYDPNPSLIQLVQILNNTGTIASKSVIAIGDSDVFYLSRSGIRSLKSRDSSNAAYVGDIGNPIDEIIIAAIQADSADGRDACGILDPRSGRYYLAIGLKVYVFSYFPSSEVSAWSVYEPGFAIEEWAFDGRQILCRSGDIIYSLGGENDDQYDSCTVTVQLPFLDAQSPATNKMWAGMDAVCESTWTVKIASDPTDIETNELAATLNKVTYGLGRVGLSTTSTHLALKLENTQAGAAKLGNLAVHYTTNEAG